MKVNSLKYPPKFLATYLNHLQRNLAILPTFWSNYDYSKSQKTLDCSTFSFQFSLLFGYTQPPKKKEAAVGASVSAAISPKVHCVSAHFGGGERENCRVIQGLENGFHQLRFKSEPQSHSVRFAAKFGRQLWDQNSLSAMDFSASQENALELHQIQCSCRHGGVRRQRGLSLP